MEIIYLFALYVIPGVNLLFCIYLMRKLSLPRWMKMPIKLNLMATIPAFFVFLVGVFMTDNPRNGEAASIFLVLLFLFPIIALVTSALSYFWYVNQPTKKALLPLGFMCLWYLGIFISFVKMAKG